MQGLLARTEPLLIDLVVFAVVKKQAKVSDNTILDALFKSLGDGKII